jgi:hypothetical protein
MYNAALEITELTVVWTEHAHRHTDAVKLDVLPVAMERSSSEVCGDCDNGDVIRIFILWF